MLFGNFIFCTMKNFDHMNNHKRNFCEKQNFACSSVITNAQGNGQINSHKIELKLELMIKLKVELKIATDKC